MTKFTITNGVAVVLPRGGSQGVAKLLGSSPGRIVVSAGKGEEEMVELEGAEIQEDDRLRLALIHPEASIFRISNGEATSVKIPVPKLIPELLRCPNPNCITVQAREPTKPEFRVISREPLTLQCIYCERYIDSGTASAQLLGT